MSDTIDPDDTISLGELRDRSDPDPELQSLRRQREELKKELRSSQEEYGDLSAFFSDLKQAVVDHGQIHRSSPLQYNASRSKKVGSPICCVMHWTDWHMGEMQDPEEIEDVDEFSPEILEHRILQKLCPSVVDWVNIHRNNYKLDELVIIDTGDNIAGDIHQELQITNAFPSPVQCVRAAMLKAAAIKLLAPHFKKVTVHFLVADNHSRLTKRCQAKQEGYNSFNYIVGCITRQSVDQLKNVQFNLIAANRKVIQVNSRRYLICHGHDVKGWAGFPWYGIERMVGREAQSRMNDMPERKFHRVVMGHWHTPIDTPMYLVGGSASGTNAYDHKNGRRSRACQCCWMVHPKNEEFDHTKFWL